jgi:hypothetical protein
MSIMSAYGTVNEEGLVVEKRIFTDDDGKEQVRMFCYTEVFHNHYQYRHVVEDNNNNRMQPISIEETWKTSYWPNRVFAFILGVTGVNTQRAFEHSAGGEAGQLRVQEGAWGGDDPQPIRSYRGGGPSIEGEELQKAETSPL